MVMLGGLLAAQAQQAPPADNATKPKIQVNFLNPCRPAQGDLEEMGRALARVKERPRFSADFEISRGVTTLTEAEARAAGVPSGTAPSSWVRIRREFPEKAVLTDVQYSLSVEGEATSEVLAMHMRESSEVLQILISDSVVGTPAQVVKLDTPPDRIRIERFGKGSIVLARCEGMDQAGYDATFAAAREILETYREAMAVQRVIPDEMARLGRGAPPRAKESKASKGNH